ncbi:phage holin family protein [Edwardsiella piscicida]|uniref:phage holin family protein n=1 Tax=Edwardsiella piscicida TaxID=1263550 RepID=UPI00084C47B2|nr:phage holin family protein [Edwardsiella piscicida]AOP41910.1 phage holin family protein [Edwardsiella piscicida]EKS7766799.1 phage holin family protein [Edwardsiella piscicida]UCQ31657.1 phage holin family protein [Edwardsiella piscicida]UCQ57986.1 phage holin family protein [Edwardsiella piscicida]
MAGDTSPTQDSAAGILGTARRIVTLLVGMTETRLRLAVVELEEEKANLIQLLLMAGVTLLFTAFGLMCLLVLLFWAVEPAYRLMALGIATALLLLLACVGAIWTLTKARHSTFLLATRKQLEIDRQLLERREKP